MKKITLIVLSLSLFVFGISNGQQVLSHSVDNTVSDGGSVACAGGGTTADNTYYRSYTPSNFGFTGDFEVTGARFPIHFTDVSGGATVDAQVVFWTSDAVFPAGAFTQIASENITFGAADDATFIDLVLTTTAIVDANTEVIVSLILPDNIDPVQFDVRIGFNELGENAPSYLSSVGCGITTPATTGSIGFGTTNIILDLVGDTALSVDDVFASQVSVYPNPVVDVLNVTLPNGTEVTSTTVFDVFGRNTGLTMVNGAIDTTSLSSGLYILSIETLEGSYTTRVVKK